MSPLSLPSKSLKTELDPDGVIDFSLLFIKSRVYSLSFLETPFQPHSSTPTLPVVVLSILLLTTIERDRNC